MLLWSSLRKIPEKDIFGMPPLVIAPGQQVPEFWRESPLFWRPVHQPCFRLQIGKERSLMFPSCFANGNIAEHSACCIGSERQTAALRRGGFGGGQGPAGSFLPSARSPTIHANFIRLYEMLEALREAIVTNFGGLVVRSTMHRRCVAQKPNEVAAKELSLIHI